MHICWLWHSSGVFQVLGKRYRIVLTSNLPSLAHPASLVAGHSGGFRLLSSWLSKDDGAWEPPLGFLRFEYLCLPCPSVGVRESPREGPQLPNKTKRPGDCPLKKRSSLVIQNLSDDKESVTPVPTRGSLRACWPSHWRSHLHDTMLPSSDRNSHRELSLPHPAGI